MRKIAFVLATITLVGAGVSIWQIAETNWDRHATTYYGGGVDFLHLFTSLAGLVAALAFFYVIASAIRRDFSRSRRANRFATARPIPVRESSRPSSASAWSNTGFRRS